MTERVIRVTLEDATASGASGVKRGLDGISVSARESQSQVDKLKDLLVELGGAFISFEAGKELIHEFTAETAASTLAFAQLQAAVRSTGGAAGFTANELGSMAGSLAEASTYGKTAIEQVQSTLLGFENIRGGVFEKTEAAVVDLAARMGGDLQGAATQLGRAINDPVQGLQSLARAGIQFSGAQGNMIENLQKSGNLLGAQQQILKVLEERLGGAADAARNTFGGALASLKNDVSDLFDDPKGFPGATDAINQLAATLRSDDVHRSFAILANDIDHIITLFAKFSAGAAAFPTGLSVAIASAIGPSDKGATEQLQDQLRDAQSLLAHGMDRPGHYFENKQDVSNITSWIETLKQEIQQSALIDAKRGNADQDFLNSVGGGYSLAGLPGSTDGGPTRDMLNGLDALTKSISRQGAEFALQAQGARSYADALDMTKAEAQAASLGFTSMTDVIERAPDKFQKLIEVLNATSFARSAAAIAGMTTSLQDENAELDAQIQLGPRASAWIEQYRARADLAKQGVGGFTQTLQDLFDSLDEKGQLKSISDLMRGLADETAQLQLQAAFGYESASAMKALQVQTQLTNAGVTTYSGSLADAAAKARLFDALHVQLSKDFVGADQAYIASLRDQLQLSQQTTQATELETAARNLSVIATDSQVEAIKRLVVELDASRRMQAEYAQEAGEAAQEIQAAFADFLFAPFDGGLKKMLKGWADTLLHMETKALATDLFSSLFKNKEGGLQGGLEAFLHAIFGGAANFDAAGSGALGNASLLQAGGFGADSFVVPPVNAGAFATGGAFMVPGSGGTDSQDIRFKATPGEKVTVQTPEQQRGSGQGAVIHVTQTNYNSGLGVSAEELVEWSRRNNEELTRALMDHLRRSGK